MSDWEPESLTPEKLHRYRKAAESAWGDDTRHESYVGHPNPAAGQCYVTSVWMTKHEGGGVGTKDGHYFWVSPDRTHVADITGDRHETPGPVFFKRSDHPMFRGFKMANPPQPEAAQRAKLFAQRADHALHHGPVPKTTGLLGADPYPGEQDANEQRDFNESPFTMLHDEPDYQPQVQPQQYQFAWVNGQLLLSPKDDHAELTRQAGASEESQGPMAVGYADVAEGHVTWRVASNVGLQSLRDVLLYHSKQVGWKFDGLVGIDGKPKSQDLGPVTSYYWRTKGNEVQIAKTPFRKAREIQVTGSTAYADELHPGLIDWAGDMGLALREFPRYNNGYGKENRQTQAQDLSQRVRARKSSEFSQGDEETEVDPEDSEPYFPTVEDAREIHDQAVLDHGQPYAPLLDPGKLESAMGRAANYYYYGEGTHPELIARAAGALAHGMGASQAFEDGNKRAAYHTTRYFLHSNDLGNLSPVDQDDTELADHLVGHGEGTHTLEDTQEMFLNRLGRTASQRRLTEYPGGGNMLDHMRVREDLELFNNGDPKFQPGKDNLDAVPSGPFICEVCGAKPDTFDAFKLHMDGHEPKDKTEVEDGHFPGLQLYDEPLGFGTDPKGPAYNAIASVKPFVMELAGTHEPSRIPEWEERSDWFGYSTGHRYYGAYDRGQLLGYAVVKDDYMKDVQGLPEAQTALWEHIAAAKGKEPKDMIAAPVPFVYDIPSDKLHIGYEGTSTHDVPGKISPGGLVEGYYEPGGKVKIQTYSTHPFSVRHLLDLFYHVAPQMEITSVEQIESDGKNTKLASSPRNGPDVGSYIKSLLPSDVAADTAYRALKAAGGKVYCVGGAPRDALQGRIPNDLDLMVSGLPSADVEHVLNQLPGNATFAGKNFGVFHYHHGGDTVEIALPRSDDYGDGGRRSDGQVKVDPDLPIADDLRRRDFTANATAVDLDTGELIDPHGGCFTGDTRVSLLDGTSPMIADLVDKEVWVYSCRGDGVFVPGKAMGKLTKYTNILVDVTLDTGEVARCTPDHPWMLNDGTYKAAAELEPMDSLMPLYRQWPDKGGYERISGRHERVWTHRAMYEGLYGEIPDRYHVHHVNETKTDNRPENLELLSPTEHASHHIHKRIADTEVWAEQMERARVARDEYNYRPEVLAAQRERGRKTGLANRGRIAKARNHKVRGVTMVELEQAVPVYDLTVEEWHNFALTIGVFVHNSDDIKRGVLRTTHPGSFREDPSRLIRALTMHARFGLTPDEATRHEMGANAHLLRGESPDLINKTFTKLLKSDNPASAIRLAHETGLLGHLLPEVEDNWDFDQNNSHHKHTLGDHLTQVLDNVSRLTTDPDVRFAALLHDIGKPGSEWKDPATGESHYYLGPDGQGANHEHLGSELADNRLRKGFNLQRSRINRITHLINHHMFAPFTTSKGARRFIAKVGDEHADDLLNLREADQTGKGQSPEEVAARTSAQSMRDLVNQARINAPTTGINALSINGNDLIALGIPQGPQIGKVMQYLQQEVVDDPSLNDPARLRSLAEQYVRAQPGYYDNSLG